jgi:hypothetical protein
MVDGHWKLISLQNLPVAAFGGADASEPAIFFQAFDLLFNGTWTKTESLGQCFPRRFF